jgi:hypothetical protein
MTSMIDCCIGCIDPGDDIYYVYVYVYNRYMGCVVEMESSRLRILDGCWVAGSVFYIVKLML